MKKPLYVLRQEAKRRDNKAFELAMANGGDQFGVPWLQTHLRVTKVLEKFGFDTSDERVRAIATLAVRATMDREWANNLANRLDDDVNFSSELERPFIKR